MFVLEASTFWYADLGSIQLISFMRLGGAIAFTSFLVEEEGRSTFAGAFATGMSLGITGVSVSTRDWSTGGAITNKTVFTLALVYSGCEVSREVSNTFSISVAVRAEWKAFVYADHGVMRADVGAVDFGLRERGEPVESTATSGVHDGGVGADSLGWNGIHECFAIGGIGEAGVCPVFARHAGGTVATWDDDGVTDKVGGGVRGGSGEQEITGGIGDVIEEEDFVAGTGFEANIRG